MEPDFIKAYRLKKSELDFTIKQEKLTGQLPSGLEVTSIPSTSSPLRTFSFNDTLRSNKL